MNGYAVAVLDWFDTNLSPDASRDVGYRLLEADSSVLRNLGDALTSKIGRITWTTGNGLHGELPNELPPGPPWDLIVEGVKDATQDPEILRGPNDGPYQEMLRMADVLQEQESM